MEFALHPIIKSEPDSEYLQEEFNIEIKNEPVFEEKEYSYDDDPLGSSIKSENNDSEMFKPFRPVLHYCDLCESVFERKEQMDIHKQTQHTASNSNRFVCSICNKNYVDSKSIKRHLLRVHDIEPPPGSKIYQCTDCSEKFSDKSHLTRHSLRHSGERPWSCDLCKKAFSRKEHLNRHLVCVHGSFSAKNSNKVVSSESQCDVAPVSEVWVEPETPAIDSSTSNNPMDMLEGTLLHLKFSLSDMQLPEMEDVKNHSDTTSNTAAYKTILPQITADALLSQVFPECQICHKKFIHSFHLAKHMELHTKQFECPVCQKKLSRKDHLKRHMANLHSDTFATQHFKCDVCARHFSQQVVYEKHMQLHTSNSKKDSHVCNVCDHEYPTRWNLRKHKLHAHNIEPVGGSSHKCQFCDRKFIDHYYLKRHQAKHNNQVAGNDQSLTDYISEKLNEDDFVKDNLIAPLPMECDVIAITDDEST